MKKNRQANSFGRIGFSLTKTDETNSDEKVRSSQRVGAPHLMYAQVHRVTRATPMARLARLARGYRPSKLRNPDTKQKNMDTTNSVAGVLKALNIFLLSFCVRQWLNCSSISYQYIIISISICALRKHLPIVHKTFSVHTFQKSI